MADFDKNDTRNAKRTASKMRKRELRVSNKGAVQFNKSNKADVKAGKSTGMKVTSSGTKAAKTNSATKPSMPVKSGVKNKVKAQGKAMTKGGLNYSGRKK